MSDVNLRAKRSVGSGPPPTLLFGEIAYSDADQAIHIGRAEAGQVTSITPANVEGLQGPEGSQGPQGEQGPQGPQGPPGDDGADGAQGPQGIQGPPGDDGAVGPQGPQGIQGPPGDDGAVGSSFVEITGTWSTNSTSYVLLGGADFKASITASAGDKIMIIPPAVAISSFSFFRLQRNGTDILLGDAATGREQTTWGVCLSGGTSVGVFYYGSLPIGGPVIDIAPGSGTYEYSIIGRSPSGLIYLGRNVHDGGVYNNRFRSQLTVINLGQ